MKTLVKTITPKQAQYWLDNCNTSNRPISKPRVQSIAADMRNNTFLTTHQGIAFDDAGVLIDGQHRLSAIVEYGMPVQLMVTTGIPRTQKNGVILNVMDVIDNGGARSTGQQLGVAHGIQNGNKYAAAAKMIQSLCINDAGGKITTAQTLYVLNNYKQDIDAIFAMKWPRLLQKAPVYGTVAFFRVLNAEKVDRFASAFGSMENVPAGSPVLALDRWVQAHGNQYGSSQRMQFAKVVGACILAYIDGRKMTRITRTDDCIDVARAAQKAKVRAIRQISGLAE